MILAWMFISITFVALPLLLSTKNGRIRNLLDTKSTETLVHAFTTCHLDMCNSLLCGLPDSHTSISKLQRIQNSAARLVTRTRFSDHFTSVLHDLHWLPVKFHIMYKIRLLFYKCLHGLVPEYLTDLIQEYKPVRNLRSSSKQKTCSFISFYYLIWTSQFSSCIP